MKYLFSLIGAMLFVTFTYAQSPLSRGNAQLNAGVGFSNHGLPVYVGFDYGVSRDVSLGAEVSYRGYSDNWQSSKYHHNIWGFSGNANYHFNSIMHIPRNWDFYAGANVGFYSWSSPSGYGGDYTSGLGIGGQIGGRYYFNNGVGLNLEFGGGNAFSGGKIGLTFKF